MRTLALTALLLLACGCDDGWTIPDTACAPDAARDDLCSTLETIRRRHHVPALAAAAWVGEDLVAQGAVGVRKIGTDVPVSVDDLWHLGSDTKAMTATVAARLVQAQTVRFESTLQALFPNVPVHAEYRSVTLQQVLMHRSGTRRDPRGALWEQMLRDRRSFEVRQAVVAQMLIDGPSEPVGEFLYSNAGYMIAGAALERASGSTWEALTASELFEPLDMKSCGVGAPATAGPIDQPWGHLRRGDYVSVGPGPHADNPASIGPAGTVHCSLRDWGKFLAVHLRGSRAESTSYLTPELLATLQSPPPGGDYALGWGVASREWAGGTVLTHSGSNSMFFATVWLAPAKNAVLVAVANAGDKRAARAVDEAFGPLIEMFVH
jgi:D-alanyl-D-alanine carboxypeptidase